MTQVTDEQAGASRLRELAAVAVAEMRSARRLARTWLFGVLTCLLGLLSYIYYAGIHGFASGMSGSIGMLNPRFLMSAIGAFLLVMFVVAMIFLAFDVRARDTRDRIAEVLDSRPLGNLTILTGRLLGLVVVVWIPVLLLSLAMQGLGGLALALDWPFGELVEPWSLMAFLLVDAPISLALWCAIVMLLAVTLRNRLVVVLVALALCGLHQYLLFQAPLYLVPAVSSFAAYSQLASDVLPRFVPAPELAQRGCLLLLAAGFLVLAAAVHPRPDRTGRAPSVGAGVALLAAGAVGIGVFVWRATEGMEQRDVWLAHHEAHRDAPAARLDHVAGQVVIDPDAGLEVTLDYTLTPPENAPPETGSLVFSLNPGMTVDTLRVNGAEASFRHTHGLLEVDLPARAASAQQGIALSLTASGVPDPVFAYLDSAIDMAQSKAGDGSLLSLLGLDASIFEPTYVALMPGAFWMPLPGSAVGREDPGPYGRDFFTVDLEVATPAEWLVAGPGKRDGSDGRFRFKPEAPVPAVGLLASRFERWAMTVAEVELELLLSPPHLRNVERFRDVEDRLRERLEEIITRAADIGLPYPYQALSVVEVPARLRAFGGGWRMPSTQALPGVALLREYGFPTSRFDIPLRRLDDVEEGAENGRPAEALRLWTLESFFLNDITGGDPLHGAARNFMGFQTGARGPGALALDFVLHDLTVQLLTGMRRGFFSAHALRSQQEVQGMVMGAFASFFGGQSGSIGGSAYMAATRKPSVWDSALGAPLAELDPSADSKKALEVLWLKGPEIAQIILDGLGRERTGALLATLRERHLGGNFTFADVATVATAVGADLDALLGDWLHDAALPGFLVSPVRVARLTDDEQGEPRYQMAVDVRNDEAVPGLVQLYYGEETEAGYIRDGTGPIRVPAASAVEIGLVGKALPQRLTFAPYLSLNRSGRGLPVPKPGNDLVDAPPLVGARPSVWRPREDDAIVVDDLDAGFTVVYDQAEDSVRIGNWAPWSMPQADMDQGLPAHNPFVPSSRWARAESPEAWGKYRRTLARVGGGDGTARGIFAATLPTAGRWRLEYHLPSTRQVSVAIGFSGRGTNIEQSSQPMRGQRSYDMRLAAGGEERALEFDAGAAEPGWNRIGDYDLPAGEALLSVSNETDGNMVMADAIRWVRLDGAAATEQ